MATPTSHPDRSFPRLHPRPASGWVNDPNGIHPADGRWHLFFQHNPDSARHERIVWGHVSSPDLLRWDEHPIALTPQVGGPDEGGCWSGVAALDDGVQRLVYSGVRAADGTSEVVLARRGATADEWIQDGAVAAGMPGSDNVTVMRDPAVFRLAGRRWAIQGAGRADGSPAILLYDAEDLDSWRYLGLLLDDTDPVAAQLPPASVWECPQLVHVGGRWVLIVSLWLNHELTGVGYLVGDLVLGAAGAPVFTPVRAGLLDEGGCFYAPQAVQDPDADRVLVWGWAREATADGVPRRSQDEHDSAGWSGALTFPRELVVDDGGARLVPAAELDGLLREPVDAPALPDQAEVELSGEGQAGLWLVGEATGAQRIWGGAVEGSTRLLIDASLIEVFPGRGASRTYRAYPAPGQRFELRADPGVELTAWRLGLPD